MWPRAESTENLRVGKRNSDLTNLGFKKYNVNHSQQIFSSARIKSNEPRHIFGAGATEILPRNFLLQSKPSVSFPEFFFRRKWGMIRLYDLRHHPTRGGRGGATLSPTIQIISDNNNRHHLSCSFRSMVILGLKILHWSCEIDLCQQTTSISLYFH
jgi:hypothetical protein